MGFWNGLKEFVDVIRKIGETPLQEIDEPNYEEIDAIADTIAGIPTENNAENPVSSAAIKSIETITVNAQNNHKEAQKILVKGSIWATIAKWVSLDIFGFLVLEYLRYLVQM